MPQNGTVYDNSSNAYYYNEGGSDDLEYGVEAANFGNESAASAASSATEVGCYESLTPEQEAGFIKEWLNPLFSGSGKLFLLQRVIKDCGCF